MTPSDPSVLPGEHLARLRTRLTGRVVLPGDDDWDAARTAWQVLADQHPVAVVVPADVADVVAAVETARALGLAVAPQGVGHAAGTIPDLRDTVLLRTTALDTVEIDPETERARIGAGAAWSQVVTAAAAHGLAAVAGMAATVGVAGFSLGGGLGWLARSHGLAANSIRALEVVDAQGRVLRVDAVRHADLFWAVRGGVAPVIVTAIEIQLYPLAELVAGALRWPIERTAEVARAWREWVATVPESVTSLVRVLRFPPIPDIPEPLRGQAFVVVEAAIQEDAETADRLFAPLRALAPADDSVRPMAPGDLATVHGDPAQPTPAHGESTVLRTLDAHTLDAFVDAALAPGSAPLLSVELRHLGGMLTPGRVDGGAVSGIAGDGLVYTVGIVPFPEAHEPVRAAARAVVDRLAPYATGGAVKNFTESAAPADELYGDAVRRLREVAAAWDPERLIRTGHPLD